MCHLLLLWSVWYLSAALSTGCLLSSQLFSDFTLTNWALRGHQFWHCCHLKLILTQQREVDPTHSNLNRGTRSTSATYAQHHCRNLLWMHMVAETQTRKWRVTAWSIVELIQTHTVTYFPPTHSAAEHTQREDNNLEMIGSCTAPCRIEAWSTVFTIISGHKYK